jgi:RNA polymerase sigma factor (TIGR02999 family)
MPEPDAQEERLQLLRAARSGDASARHALLNLCYTELRRLAHRLLAGDAAALRLQPTELVHEAALRVLNLDRMEWRDRAHFLATAATIMRQALIDEVRKFRSAKRQARPVVTTLFDPGVATIDLDIEKLDAALRELAQVDPERARLVELRFFAGLTVGETAEVLELSTATVKRRWDVSRAWLLRRLSAVP